jgi:hypothetical protein
MFATALHLLGPGSVGLTKVNLARNPNRVYDSDWGR